LLELYLMKSTSSQNKQESAKKSNKKILWALGGLIFIFFFYMKSKDLILNYPTYLYYISFGFSFVLVGIINKWKWIQIHIKGRSTLDFVSYLVNGILPHLILAFFISRTLLIPFNYYNIHHSKSNPPKVVYCEIESLSARARHNNVFFRFNGEIEAINGHKPIMNEIYKKQPVKDYALKLILRKGLIDSYIVSDWDIVIK
jgi:hypothetical protein